MAGGPIALRRTQLAKALKIVPYLTPEEVNLLWVPWISIIVVMVILAGGFHVVNPLYLTETGISVSEPAGYVLYFTIVGLFVILSFITGRRAFCHYVCWMAPFMVIGTKIKNFFKWPSLHLEATSAKYKQCRTCWMSWLSSLRQLDSSSLFSLRIF
jgi:polyferredoxin